jgi:hypothetical protein
MKNDLRRLRDVGLIPVFNVRKVNLGFHLLVTYLKNLLNDVIWTSNVFYKQHSKMVLSRFVKICYVLSSSSNDCPVVEYSSPNHQFVPDCSVKHAWKICHEGQVTYLPALSETRPLTMVCKTIHSVTGSASLACCMKFLAGLILFKSEGDAIMTNVLD